LEAFGLDEAMTRLNPPGALRQIDLMLEDLVRASAPIGTLRGILRDINQSAQDSVRLSAVGVGIV
jgi:hypothetical protein